MNWYTKLLSSPHSYVVNGAVFVCISVILSHSLYSHSLYLHSLREGLLAPPSKQATPVDKKIDDRLVVIARYDEDVSWASIYLGGRIPYEVCQKGDPIPADSSGPRPYFYVTPNKGQEASCYLAAIIKHYHNLPDQMAFVHGHHKSHHGDNAFNLLSYQWEKRLPYASLSSKESAHRPFRNGAHVCMNSTECDNQPIQRQGQITASVWDTLLSDLLNMTRPGTIRTPCCASFVVTKERILEHALETYKSLLRFLVETDMPDYWSSRVFEYLWHILFGMPAYYVDLPKCERFHCNADGEWIIPRPPPATSAAV